MSVIATDAARFSGLVKFEFEPSLGYCRDVVTMYDSAMTVGVGTVLGKFVASPTGTATAGTNTGNGTMGTVTVTSNANLVLGTYTLRVVKAAANAGDFVVVNPDGESVGNGTVGVAYSGGGLAFTLADGSTDFAVGDTFTIVVAGTVKYKRVEATATDGSEVPAAIVIGDASGNAYDFSLAATTDTKVLVLSRGPVIVADDALRFGSSVNTTPELAAAYASLKALGIIVETAA